MTPLGGADACGAGTGAGACRSAGVGGGRGNHAAIDTAVIGAVDAVTCCSCDDTALDAATVSSCSDVALARTSAAAWPFDTARSASSHDATHRASALERSMTPASLPISSTAREAVNVHDDVTICLPRCTTLWTSCMQRRIRQALDHNRTTHE
jgi:hypothetical protein